MSNTFKAGGGRGGHPRLLLIDPLGTAEGKMSEAEIMPILMTMQFRSSSAYAKIQE